MGVLPRNAISRSLPVRILTGKFWHQCPPARRLLDAANPAETSGRYHRSGDSGVWYASSSETGAWAELFRHHESGGVSPSEVRRLIGKVRVHDLRVLDLTNARTRASLNVSETDLTGDDPARCQSIANEARAAGYDAILAPSAALKGRKTLAVFSSALKKVTPINSRTRKAPPRMSRFSPQISRGRTSETPVN